MCKRFIQKYNFDRFHEKIQKLKKKLFLPPFTSNKFTGFHQITNEFYEPLMNFLEKRKRKKRIVFKKINQNHIDYFDSLMKQSKTKNLTLCQKRKRMA